MLGGMESGRVFALFCLLLCMSNALRRSAHLCSHIVYFKIKEKASNEVAWGNADKKKKSGTFASELREVSKIIRHQKPREQ